MKFLNKQKGTLEDDHDDGRSLFVSENQNER